MNSEAVTLETGDIDWGDSDVNDNAADIDFNVSIEDSGIKVEDSGLAGGVAKGAEALLLLDSPQHRDQFLDEIFEVLFCDVFIWKTLLECFLSNYFQLEAFLKMRLFELNAIENSNSVTFMLNDGLDNHTSDSIVCLLSDVQNVVERATSEVLQHLYQLKHSEKYTKRWSRIK